MLYFMAVALAIVFPTLRDPMPRMAAATALCFVIGMMFIPLMERIASIPETVKLLIKLESAKPAYSWGLMEEIASVAAKMGMKPMDDYERVKYVSGWMNAAITADGTVVLGQAVVEEFKKEHREGIIGHELGHKKGHHNVKRAALFLLATPLFIYLAQSPFPFFVNVLMVFAAAGLIMPLVSWPFEYRADTVAAKCLGEQKVIDALMKIAGSAGVDITRDSYTHPSISRRIRRLQRLATKVRGS